MSNQRWTMPRNVKNMVALAQSFDAGPEPVVNGILWTEMHKYSDADRHRITVETRGPNAWVIFNGCMVLNTYGEWEYEASPSNREDDFKERTRFSTAMEAISIANHFRERVTKGVICKNPEKISGAEYASWQTSDQYKIFRAIVIAYAAHRGQFRKFSEGDPTPYITHPEKVANSVEAWLYKGAKNNYDHTKMVMAAWLHDVVEDCAVKFTKEINDLSPDVYKLVMELTNPSKSHPKLRRAERKKMDREHLATVSPEAKVIKLIDRLSNLMEIYDQPAEPDFKLLYANESELLLPYLQGSDTEKLECELSTWIKKIQMMMKVDYILG